MTAWGQQKPAIDRLAQLAYEDAIGLTTRLYVRQGALEAQLRALVTEHHKRHAHISEDWTTCYTKTCTEIRHLLAARIEPE